MNCFSAEKICILSKQKNKIVTKIYYIMNSPLFFLGPVLTSNFTWAESNTY